MTAVAELEEALDLAHRNPRAPQPYCKDKPDRYVDYAVPPAEAECKAMCAPCPLLAICKAAAREERAEWGIRGGVAWHGGKQWHWLARFGLLVGEHTAHNLAPN